MIFERNLEIRNSINEDVEMGDEKEKGREREREAEKEERYYGRAFPVVKISAIPDLRWLLALITFVIS